MYSLLLDRKIKEFNKLREQGVECDFRGLSFRACDLRGINAAGIDFSNSKFKIADLRGINFSYSNLEGATLNQAKIAGVLFPRDYSSNEILLSVTHGTRLRKR